VVSARSSFWLIFSVIAHCALCELAWLVVIPKHISSFHGRKHFLAVVSRRAKKPISKAEYSLVNSAEVWPLTRVNTSLFLADTASLAVAGQRQGCDRASTDDVRVRSQRIV
jgi:hypothetical protein